MSPPGRRQNIRVEGAVKREGEPHRRGGPCGGVPWVCELEPRDPFSYTALSVACMRAGRIAEAEDALARSRMLQGGQP